MCEHYCLGFSFLMENSKIFKNRRRRRSHHPQKRCLVTHARIAHAYIILIRKKMTSTTTTTPLFGSGAFVVAVVWSNTSTVDLVFGVSIGTGGAACRVLHPGRAAGAHGMCTVNKHGELLGLPLVRGAALVELRCRRQQKDKGGSAPVNDFHL